MKKCVVCKKTKAEPLDLREPWCSWDGKGKHPRFVWNRVRLRWRKFCGNCPHELTIRELYLMDMETNEIFCYDCGMLIMKGVDYQREKHAA